MTKMTKMTKITETTERPMRLLELFSGIGAQTTALQNLGIEHTSVCCEIDGQAHSAYEAMHGLTENLGDITKVERLPPCDLLTYSYPCIRGDQRVHTDRGLIPIKDVKVGDEVLTHKGRFRTVTGHAMTGVHGTVQVISSVGSVVCTRDHMVLTRCDLDPDSGEGYTDRRFSAPYWAPASSLTERNLVGYPIITEERMFEWYALDDFLGREEFWWLCGRYLSRGRPLTGKTGVIAVIEKDKVEDIERFKELFRVVSVQESNVYKIDTCSMEPAFLVMICDEGFAEFCAEMFGDGAENRFIDRRVKELPVNLLRAFLDGFVAGQRIHDRRKWLWCCKSSSWRLMMDMQDIVMKVTRRPVTYLRISPPEGSSDAVTHVITWNTDIGVDDRMFEDGGVIWSPVHSVQDCDEAVEVYDISVEEDESFVVEGLIVHNCQAVSVAGSRTGMEEGSGTSSSLVWEVGRLLTVAKEHGELPEYLLMENVKGVLNNPNKAVFDRWCKHLTSLGYTQSYAVLNAKDFGVPQSRERIFMVSSLTHGALVFPSATGRKVMLKDVMESDVDERYFLTKERIASYERHRRNQEEAGRGFGWNPAVPEGVAPTVVTSPSSSSTSTVVVSGGKDWRERTDGIVVSGHLNLPGWFESALRVYDPKGVAPTIPTGAGGGHIPRLDVSDSPAGSEQVRIRYLTPRECWRLQGFDDERIDRAFKVIEHDSARYRMAGNSIAVPCLEAIFKAMFIDKRFAKRGRLDEW